MQFPIHIPFVEALGFELIRFEAGEAEIQLELRAEHLNSFKVAHGGISMTLLDVVMAHAARSINRDLPDAGPGVVTVEMKTSFMRPGEGRLQAVGKLLHRTSTMAFVEGSIYSSTGALCAHATGTFKYVRKLPTEGRKLQTLQRRLDGSGSD
ncbi:MAG: PaaI family thioesterase [Leptothrix sp. (in: b-proteobacteria)]